MSKREPIDWFTMNGNHIPIYEGQTREEVAKKFMERNKAKKSDDKKPTTQSKKVDEVESKKQSDIAKAKKVADKLNEEAAYQNSIKQGNDVTMKNGKMSFKGQTVSDVTVPDDLDTTRNHSLTDHMKNGKLTDERREVHRKIIQDYFANKLPYKPEQKKYALFTGGGGASGKGQLSKRITDFYSKDDKPIHIDPDAIKRLLAIADGKDTDAGYYHEESSALASTIYDLAIKNNFPVMYDGTATGVNSVMRRLELARKHGYSPEMAFIFSDWNTVRDNSLFRYKNGDDYGEHRYVPIKNLLWAHVRAYDAVTQLQDQFDKFELYDNSNRQLKHVGRGSKGKKLDIKDKAAWEKFSKSVLDFTLTPEVLEMYDNDISDITEQLIKEGKLKVKK